MIAYTSGTNSKSSDTGFDSFLKKNTVKTFLNRKPPIRLHFQILKHYILTSEMAALNKRDEEIWKRLKESFLRDVYRRIKDSSSVAQRNTSLCGPASFIKILIDSKPTAYLEFMISLFENGRASIGALNIVPSEACKSFHASEMRWSIIAVDWMALASIRDSQNSVLDYSSPSKEVAGITTPGDIVDWAKKANISATAKYYSQLERKGVHNLSAQPTQMKSVVHLKNALSRKRHAALLIDAKMLDQSFGGISLTRMHWVVLDGDITVSGGVKVHHPGLDIEKYYNERISFKVYSWGTTDWASEHRASSSSKNINLKLGEFFEHLFGYVVI